MHPVTGVTITQYRKLANDPVTSDIWKEHAFGKEFGCMAQGDNRSDTKGKNCIFVMTHDKIAQMRAKGKKPTYARVVVDFRPQKEDPNRVRITAGGNLIKYVGELTTRTADLTTEKMIWDSVISTDGEKIMGLDIGDFYKSGVMDIQWHPGQENLAYYTSKHHDSKHHQIVRPWYIQEDKSPRVLPRAAKPSAL